ncbi:carbohydrate ABC transporter permease [Paenibacillus sp. sptzw28]|uniref:carbohydrate ABC transporter permease n=1 Tax=Paenibacillus sp. sptzw28 TaxID=715179 RepID=UPI002163B809|nr:sugar ABC transporter permease [Paenibacillus sp. sptzw28]
MIAGKQYSLRRSDGITGFLFVLPAFILLLVFVFIPMAKAFYYSFNDYMLVSGSKTFVGLKNYADLLQDTKFLNSIKHTFYFAVIVIPVQTAIALGLALLVKPQFKYTGFFRTAFFVPVVISTAVAGTVFKLIYNRDFGLLNVLIGAVGIPKISLLSNADIAMNGVIILGIWKAAGFFMIVYLAGLNNIPQDLYESARVDGASKLQQFFYITLPLLKRTTAFIIIMTTIDAIKLSGIVFVLTSGGPNSSTETIVYFIYKTAFDQMQMGYASAAAFILFFMILIISVIQMLFLRSKVNY